MSQTTITFVANVSIGKARKATLNGRKHLVAPLSMLIPGVLPGSAGSVFYPSDVVEASVDYWNGMPQVVNHPYKGANPVSARTPEYMDNFGIGTVYNATFDNGLKGEGWFDIDNTRRVDSRVLLSLMAGTTIELSTGIFAKAKKALPAAVFNEKKYDYEVEFIKPDHLAILPDSVGACSITDGCGVLVNALKETLELALQNELSHESVRNLLSQALRDRSKQSEPYCYIEYVFDDFIIYEKSGEWYRLNYLKNDSGVSLAKMPVEVKRQVEFVPVNNESKNLTESVVADQSKGDDMALETAKKAQIINDLLVANCSCWKGDGDKKILEAFPDEKLTALHNDHLIKQSSAKLIENVKKGHTSETGDRMYFDEASNSWKMEKKATISPETQVNNTNNNQPRLTVEEQEDLAFARQEKVKQKHQIIARLVVNVADPAARQTKGDRLMQKSMAELNELLELLPPPDQNGSGNGNGSGQYRPDLYLNNQPSFVGASTPTFNQLTAADREDILDPVGEMDWSKK